MTSFDSTSPFRRRSRTTATTTTTRDRHVARAARAAGRGQREAAAAHPRRRDRRPEGAVDSSSTRFATLRAFDRGEATVDEAVAALREYEVLHDETRDRSRPYREVLEAAPWKRCDCAVCRDAGIQVIIFRGTERNKRRGFHNLHVFARRFAGELQPERVADVRGRALSLSRERTR